MTAAGFLNRSADVPVGMEGNLKTTPVAYTVETTMLPFGRRCAAEKWVMQDDDPPNAPERKR